MDIDIKELEDLAQDKHADLQDPVTKVVDSPTEAPGVTEASEGTPTQANTIASELAESQCSKQQSNR
jgi:hypothetical protein